MVAKLAAVNTCFVVLLATGRRGNLLYPIAVCIRSTYRILFASELANITHNMIWRASRALELGLLVGKDIASRRWARAAKAKGAHNA